MHWDVWLSRLRLSRTICLKTTAKAPGLLIPCVLVQTQKRIIRLPPVQLRNETGVLGDMLRHEGLDLLVRGIVKLAEYFDDEEFDCWVLVGEQRLELGGP